MAREDLQTWPQGCFSTGYWYSFLAMIQYTLKIKKNQLTSNTAGILCTGFVVVRCRAGRYTENLPIPSKATITVVILPLTIIFGV